MTHATNLLLKVRLIGLGGLLVLFSASGSAATKHVILFGGSAGFSYSPGFLTAAVGDTIEWQGNFSFHPLSSTTIPAGALTWANSSGTEFQYVITVPGLYNYQCDDHAPAMVGSFDVILAGVQEQRVSGVASSFRLEQNYPNPFNPSTKIQFTIVNRQLTIVKVYDLLGREVATLVNEVKEPGTHTVEFDGSNLPSGVYFYRLEAGSSVAVRTLMLLK